ncbi:MAG: methylated-DNA--[protein]-cysteine S-methyltransferase [Psychrobacter sp.]|nr:methylated-DNA--[protein]-cysteine S-methyltransferase [Psychrobacter sp.]
MRHYQVKDDEAYYIDENSLSEDNPLQALLLSTIKQLQQYTNGERQAFDLPLDLSQGSPFQQRVWQALQDISYGETISYAQLAQNIGQPTAYRAVANANGKNPFSIVIPCHRVIASDGSLGGYTGGLDKKRLLLAIESQHN